MIEIDFMSFTGGEVDHNRLAELKKKKEEIRAKVFSRADMQDWVDIETTISKQEKAQILELASEIRQNCEVFLVLGIGGSFWGAKALIEGTQPYFKKKKPEILFAGFDLSEEYLDQLLDYIKDKEVYVNVISKSGTTLEVMRAFDRVYTLMKSKYPQDYVHRIIATTDLKSGSLREKCRLEGFRSFGVPEQIGGRYSVLTPVGMLPVAVSGVDIEKILHGAQAAKNLFDTAFDFACARQLMFEKRRPMEMLTYYEKKLDSLASWYQQLFAESLGKNKCGILPIPNQETCNLHSIGQFFQDGSQVCFKTVLNVGQGTINNTIYAPIAEAHSMGSTPSIVLNIQKFDAEGLGEFMYFCFLTTAAQGFLCGINPFDQPGVTKYKELIEKALKTHK